jgi:23S rRNA G2445 N2-methylase RlmL
MVDIPEFLMRFKPNRNPVYMLTALPGLESTAANEAEVKANIKIQAMLRGKIFLSPKGLSFSYEPLRCTDNVYELLCTGQMGTTRAALQSLQSELVVDLKYKGHSFIVNASIAGRHNYSRFEAADALSVALAAQGLMPGTMENREIEFRLDCVDGFYIISIKKTDAGFRFRGNTRLFSKAALRPTVAASLVWASKPEQGDVFFDPFCGSGTVLNERAFYPFGKIIGADTDGATLEAARANVDARINLLHGDSLTLDIQKSSVDCIATNPPWGGQIKSGDISGLYFAFIKRSRFWLKPGGRIIILTPLDDILRKAAEKYGFDLKIMHTISLHGTLCRLYKLV